MGEESRSEQQQQQPCVVMVPFPALGHITPMLHLARTLHDLFSFRSIIVIPTFIHRRLFTASADDYSDRDEFDQSVVFRSLPDGIKDDRPDFFAIETAMEDHMPEHLEGLLLGGGSGSVACVVVDLLASWALQVGRRCGIPVAGFWPAMLATYRIVCAIPVMIQSGLISESGIPLHDQASIQDIVRLSPNLTAEDLPWLVGDKSSQTKRFEFWLRLLGRSRSLRWILVNSFPNEDETHEVNQEDDRQKILNVAPLTMTSISDHDKWLKRHVSFWAEEDKECLQWLSLQEPSSVVYVSFGSWVGPMQQEKVAEMALGLESTKRPFLWVLAHSGRNGLPNDYLDRVGGRGKMVAWAPQTEVLRHVAVGCHLSHCGWNSTQESIEFGKSMICCPLSGDQFVNCRYIVSVWKVGVQLQNMERREVVRCVNLLLMESGEDVRRRVVELRRRIVEDGVGRALSCLESFIGHLKNVECSIVPKGTAPNNVNDDEEDEEQDVEDGQFLPLAPYVFQNTSFARVAAVAELVLIVTPTVAVATVHRRRELI